MKKRSHLVRNLIAVMAILIGFVSASAWLVNRPGFLKFATRVASARSGWQIDVGWLTWQPIRGDIRIEKISALNSESGKGFSADGVKIGYRLLGFLRGKLVIDELAVDGVKINLPKSDAPKDEGGHKKLNLAKLVLIKNIELEDGRVKGLSLAFGYDLSLAADEISISLNPKFFGKAGLSINANGILLSKGEGRIISAGVVGLKSSTNLSRWGALFPYINDIGGDVKLSDLTYGGLAAESLSAEMSFLDDEINLSNLELIIGGKALSGRLSANLADENFDLAIDIPRPITLPYIGVELYTVDTEGDIQGSIRLEGSGLIPSESSGKGNLNISHRFAVSRDSPVSIESDLSWSKGVVKLPKIKIRAGSDEAQAEGSVNIHRKQFKISAEGTRFPLEHVFDKFKDPHLAKIFGPTDFKGTLEGWGRKFTANVTGITYGGGWKPITAERIESELSATYDSVRLKGDILSGTKKTGKAGLSIKYGKATVDHRRTGSIELEGSVFDHPVADSLAVWGLQGVGNGRVAIKGQFTNFTGEAEGSIAGGRFFSIPFDRAHAKAGLSRRHIKFTELAVKFPRMTEPSITGPLNGEIEAGRFRLHGAPIAGLNVDATYRYADSRWNVSEISWADPNRPEERLSASGSVVAGGGLDLKVKGVLDLDSLAFLSPLMRGGSGPVGVDVWVRGTTSDPKFFGSIAFDDNTLSPRAAALTLEELNGTARLDGSRIGFDAIKARIDDGEFELSGSVNHSGYELSSADLSIKGSAMRYRSPDRTFNLEFDGNLALTGSFPNPLLKGDITILDGKYTKDFRLIDVIAGGKLKSRNAPKEPEITFNPRLDLHVRNTGDLAIRNNVGDIWLNMNADIKGTRKDPVLSGSIDTTDGKVHYLGMEFDITKGFIELRERYAAPYLEVYAQREINTYNVNLVLHGPTDNLVLDLSATSASGQLEKRDVVSLLMFGATEQERNEAAQRAGNMVATSMVGQAVTGIVEQPVLKFTHLDVFRLEAATPGSTNISRVSFGKQISDRLSVNFATDINTVNAVQTVVGEYQMTDNFIVSGQRSSDANYKITGALRFRLR